MEKCDKCGDKRINLNDIRIDEGEQIKVCDNCYSKLEEDFNDI